MLRNQEWHARIKDVEREYHAMRQAIDRLLKDVGSDPGVLHESLRPADVAVASRNLEGTYVVRLFAEFETAARTIWAQHKDTHPKTTDLLVALAARHKVPNAQCDCAHRVRDYRNSLVHEREEETEAVPIATARSHLCRFLSYLLPRN